MQSMSFGERVAALKNVAGHLRSFGPDQQAFIFSCYNKTELKTQLVARLVEADRYLADKDNASLSKEFQTVKSGFIQYIEGRIRSLETSPVLNPGEEACSHIQDVLFATKMLISPQWKDVPDLLENQKAEVRQLRRGMVAYESLIMQKRGCSQEEAHTILHPLRVQLLNLEREQDSSSIEPICEKITQLSEKLFK